MWILLASIIICVFLTALIGFFFYRWIEGGIRDLFADISFSVCDFCEDECSEKNKIEGNNL